jgi:endonuclease/exonuclease/phosphatase family metal-dependent hydrolase
MSKLRVLLICVLCAIVGDANSGYLVLLPDNEEENNIESRKEDSEILFDISFMSYNMMALPSKLIGKQNNFRFDKLPDSLLALNVDVLALQEAFHPKIRRKINNSFDGKYYCDTEFDCDQKILPFVKRDCYGGLLTLSKYPIISEEFYQFPVNSDYSWVEKSGAKGFLVTMIQYKSEKLCIVNTHLYSGGNLKAEKIRMDQVQFMHEVLKKTSAYNQHKIVVLGDFNVHHPDVEYSEVYQYVTNEMMFMDTKPRITSQDFTYDTRVNPYVPARFKRTKLDYIFYYSPQNDFQVVFQTKSMDRNKTLSDHFGWYCEFLLVDDDLERELYTATE